MALEEFSELKRIRYTTSHPIDMTDDLVECYSKSRKLVPFIHLPIQSGSNRILKLMNRNHTVEYYLSVYEKLKKINSKIEFSSDFIIAYPGETEKDFEVWEQKHHIMRSIRQCIRDVRQTGKITKGEQEFIEQWGGNPSYMYKKITEYVNKE